jgi:hypothetical protein
MSSKNYVWRGHTYSKERYDRIRKAAFFRMTSGGQITQKPQIKDTPKPIPTKTYSENHKNHENQFLKEIDFKNLKKEVMIANIDGKIVKYTGSRRDVKSWTIRDEFLFGSVQDIHNHPSKTPPSSRDIFKLLYSGKNDRVTVIDNTGNMWIMKRKPETRQLSSIDSSKFKNTWENANDRQKNSLQGRINSDRRSSMTRFTRFYNDNLRIYVAQNKLTKENYTKEKEFQGQDQMVDIMSKHYNFSVKRMKHS